MRYTLFIAALIAFASCKKESKPPMRYSGRVVDNFTGQYVSGAQVELRASYFNKTNPWSPEGYLPAPVLKTTTSADGGFFYFDQDMPAGSIPYFRAIKGTKISIPPQLLYATSLNPDKIYLDNYAVVVVNINNVTPANANDSLLLRIDYIVPPLPNMGERNHRTVKAFPNLSGSTVFRDTFPASIGANMQVHWERYNAGLKDSATINGGSPQSGTPVTINF
jgi:hypothetical protein